MKVTRAHETNGFRAETAVSESVALRRDQEVVMIPAQLKVPAVTVREPRLHGGTFSQGQICSRLSALQVHAADVIAHVMRLLVRGDWFR